MTHFDASAVHTSGEQPSHFGHEAETGHAERLVEGQYLSRKKVHRLQAIEEVLARPLVGHGERDAAERENNDGQSHDDAVPTEGGKTVA